MVRESFIVASDSLTPRSNITSRHSLRYGVEQCRYRASLHRLVTGTINCAMQGPYQRGLFLWKALLRCHIRPRQAEAIALARRV